MDTTDKVFDVNNLPADFNVSSTQTADFEPIDPGEIYTVEVRKAELRENKFFKPEETDRSKRGEKYQFNFELAILNDGDYYGRRLWVSTGTSFKPEGKKGPTKLYKMVTSAMGVDMGWDEVNSFNPDPATFVSNLQKEVVGHQLKVAIENSVKTDGKTVSKVTSFNKVKKGKELPKFDQAKATAVGEKLKKAPKKKSEDVDPKDIPF